MEFWITIVGLLRRKWVVIPAAVTTLVLGTAVYLGTAKTYVASTTMVLTTTEFGGTESRDPAAPTGRTNPLLNFSDSLSTTSAILIQAMSTKDAAAELGVREPTKLVVDDGRSNPHLLGLNGPFLFVLVQSTTPDESSRVVAEVQRAMREKLNDWQESVGAPRRTFVSLVDVVPPSTPEINRSRAIKHGLLASVFGLVLSVGVAYFHHQRLSRRRADTTVPPVVADRARPSHEASEPTAGEGETADPPRGGVTASPKKKPEQSSVPVPVKKNVRARNR